LAVRNGGEEPRGIFESGVGPEGEGPAYPREAGGRETLTSPLEGRGRNQGERRRNFGALGLNRDHEGGKR